MKKIQSKILVFLSRHTLFLIALVLVTLLFASPENAAAQSFSAPPSDFTDTVGETRVGEDYSRQDVAVVRAEQNRAIHATLNVPPATSALITETGIVSPKIRVTDVYRFEYGERSERDQERNSAGIGDIIIAEVKNLQTLLNQADCLDENAQTIPECEKKEIALYLEGREVTGVVAIGREPEEGRLQFRLHRNTDNDETWADLFGAPPLGSGFFKRPTQVSVGLEGGHAQPTDIKGGKKFQLTRIIVWNFWVSLIIVVVLLYLMRRLARDSDILRDIGQSPKGGKRKPYSLARCQMAFWFFLVMVSFFFIWQVTGTYDIITQSILGLIGIGAGTALGAAAIDTGKQTDVNSKINSLEEEITTLDAQIEADPSPTNLDELKTKKAQKEAKVKEVKGATAPTSRGFVTDIFSDANGGSFHRYQMFAWTIVLGFLFISSVYSRLSMPEFSATLLALLGISSGTYLGFKIPEQKTPETGP